MVIDVSCVVKPFKITDPYRFFFFFLDTVGVNEIFYFFSFSFVLTLV